jgi:hypothetical protein
LAVLSLSPIPGVHWSFGKKFRFQTITLKKMS